MGFQRVEEMIIFKVLKFELHIFLIPFCCQMASRVLSRRECDLPETPINLSQCVFILMSGVSYGGRETDDLYIMLFPVNHPFIEQNIMLKHSKIGLVKEDNTEILVPIQPGFRRSRLQNFEISKMLKLFLVLLFPSLVVLSRH